MTELAWRELERARVAAGVGVFRPSWPCTHSKKGVYQPRPQYARHIKPGAAWRNYRKLKVVA